MRAHKQKDSRYPNAALFSALAKKLIGGHTRCAPVTQNSPEYGHKQGLNFQALGVSQIGVVKH
jgi:hypothetical protein